MTPPDYPVRCSKCGDVTLDIEQHLIDARHWEDPDYPLHLARVRVDHAQEVLEIAQAALDDAHDNLARLEST